MKRSRIIKLTLFGLLLIGSVFCYYLMEENKEHKSQLEEYKKAQNNSISDQTPKVVYISKKDSVTHIQKEVVQSKEIRNAISKDYFTYVNDTLSLALNVAADKIKELSRIKAKLEGELHATRVELEENKAQRVYYESKYLNIITHHDSLGNPQKLKYTYNAQLNVVHFAKRKNFWSKEKNYIDVSSPDKNFKINGLEHYKKEISLPSRNIGIGLQFGYGMDKDFKPNPYFGIGLSYNLIKF